ncbi:hypothetical protein [Xanthocytophaga flava]|nr:hypothetical protein [Xanthocytophaga flavus]
MADNDEIKKRRRRKALSNDELREVAKLLFIQTDLTQKEIAVRVGCNEHVLGRWIKEFNWHKLKISETSYKDAIRVKLYAKYQEALDNNKPIEELQAISMEIEKMPATSVPPQQAVKIVKDLTRYLLEKDTELGKALFGYMDDFIKSNYY